MILPIRQIHLPLIEEGAFFEAFRENETGKHHETRRSSAIKEILIKHCSNIRRKRS